MAAGFRGVAGSCRKSQSISQSMARACASVASVGGLGASRHRRGRKSPALALPGGWSSSASSCPSWAISPFRCRVLRRRAEACEVEGASSRLAAGANGPSSHSSLPSWSLPRRASRCACQARRSGVSSRSWPRSTSIWRRPSRAAVSVSRAAWCIALAWVRRVVCWRRLASALSRSAWLQSMRAAPAAARAPAISGSRRRIRDGARGIMERGG